MPDISDLRIDCHAEQQSLRQLAEAEAKAKGAIAKQRQLMIEQRTELEAKLGAVDDQLRRYRDDAQRLEAEAAKAQKENQRGEQTLSSLWPKAEEAAAEARAADAKLHAARCKGEDLARAEQERMETARNVYAMYAAATGVQWDLKHAGQRGCVALGEVRAFDVTGSKSATAAADEIWATIEACLPQQRPVVSAKELGLDGRSPVAANCGDLAAAAKLSPRAAVDSSKADANTILG